LEDDSRANLLSSLLATRPTNAWLSLGMVLVGGGFIAGLLLGHRSAPAVRAAPASVAGPIAIAIVPSAAPALAPKPDDSPPASATAPLADTAAPAAASAVPPAASADPTKNGAAKLPLEPFNAKAARTNLTNAAVRAQKCRDTTAPAGSASTVVTFVPSGKVADVTVTTPAYAGTHTGRCIVSKLKSAQVPPYSGGPETMKKTLTLK
jgi:hypothetical protein